MTDKKTGGNKPPTKPSKPVKPVKETKEAYFVRIATPRVKNIHKSLRILGNCSNRNNYSYTKEQVEKMFNSIKRSLENTYNKFTPSKQEQESFEF